MLQLYTYYRSVSAHRVRIALNHKGIPYKSLFVDQDNGDHRSAEYLRLNPQGLVPALVVSDNLIITQSAAILEYLEERYPERPLLPTDIDGRARVRSFAQVCIADTQPMNILRVYQYMRDAMSLDHATRRRWYEYWAHKGFRAMESLLANDPMTGDYCHGDQPTLADVCLVPQMYNAEKNKLDLSRYPTLRRIYRSCQALPAFQAAAPETQPDRVARSV
jgi:maleylacetoacetate isomerase